MLCASPNVICDCAHRRAAAREEIAMMITTTNTRTGAVVDAALLGAGNPDHFVGFRRGRQG